MSDEVRFDSSLRDRLSDNLQQHRLREHADKGLTQAAVCVIVLDSDAILHGTDPLSETATAAGRKQLLADIPGLASDNDLSGTVEGTAGGAAVLLTRRTSKLKDHPGQWALPGGRVDSGESAFQAAVSEAEEEVGLRLSSKDLLSLDIIDEIIPEPIGGAHRDKDLILDNVRNCLEKNLNFFSTMDKNEILNHRKSK